jgi:Sulfotransferase family
VPPEQPDRLGFVVCPSYHGATLLALLLNNHSRLSTLGDTVPTRTYDQICACGKKVSECEFWQMVARELEADRFAHLSSLIPILPWPLERHSLEGAGMRITTSAPVDRAVGRLATASADAVLPAVWRLHGRSLDEYVALYNRFYGLIARLHGTSTFVDGSKSWRKVALLAPRLGREARVLHLVRDPRGFLASWRRNLGDDDPRAVVWQWVDLHLPMSRLARVVPYRVLRYEDLCADPQGEMAKVFEFLGVEPESVVGPPKFPEKHHLMGNAMLFAFDGEVRLDERWRDELSQAEQAEALRHAGALAERFGYT